jgi:Type IV secretion system pilin
MFATMIVAFVSVSSVVFGQSTTIGTTKTISEGSFNRQYIGWLPDVPGSQNTASNADFSKWIEGAINGVKNVINWILGLLALVAVVILIYTGVKMLLNSSDDKAIDEWYKTVKNIFIALLFIGASWLIVRFIFYVVGLFAA